MAFIETKRLLISKLTPEDAAFILKLVNSSAWLKYVGNKHIEHLEDARRYIAHAAIKSYKENGLGPYKVVLKNTNTAIGICGLLKREALDDVELVYALLPTYTGHGYAYEAADRILVYAQEVLGLERIIGIASADNVRSLTLLQKLGFRFESTLRFQDQDVLLLSIQLRS